MEPGLYGTDGTDPEEASGLLEPEDTLDGARGVPDVLDTGWSPPERAWAVDGWGTTEAEEAAGESLDGRLARELPDGGGGGGGGAGDASEMDGGPRRRLGHRRRAARRRGGRRAGRSAGGRRRRRELRHRRRAVCPRRGHPRR